MGAGASSSSPFSASSRTHSAHHKHYHHNHRASQQNLKATPPTTYFLDVLREPSAKPNVYSVSDARIGPRPLYFNKRRASHHQDLESFGGSQSNDILHVSHSHKNYTKHQGCNQRLAQARIADMRRASGSLPSLVALPGDCLAVRSPPPAVFRAARKQAPPPTHLLRATSASALNQPPAPLSPRCEQPARAKLIARPAQAANKYKARQHQHQSHQQHHSHQKPLTAQNHNNNIGQRPQPSDALPTLARSQSLHELIRLRATENGQRMRTTGTLRGACNATGRQDNGSVSSDCCAIGDTEAAEATQVSSAVASETSGPIGHNNLSAQNKSKKHKKPEAVDSKQHLQQSPNSTTSSSGFASSSGCSLLASTVSSSSSSSSSSSAGSNGGKQRKKCTQQPQQQQHQQPQTQLRLSSSLLSIVDELAAPSASGRKSPSAQHLVSVLMQLEQNQNDDAHTYSSNTKHEPVDLAQLSRLQTYTRLRQLSQSELALSYLDAGANSQKLALGGKQQSANIAESRQQQKYQQNCAGGKAKLLSLIKRLSSGERRARAAGGPRSAVVADAAGGQLIDCNTETEAANVNRKSASGKLATAGRSESLCELSFDCDFEQIRNCGGSGYGAAGGCSRSRISADCSSLQKQKQLQQVACEQLHRLSRNCGGQLATQSAACGLSAMTALDTANHRQRQQKQQQAVQNSAPAPHSNSGLFDSLSRVLAELDSSLERDDGAFSRRAALSSCLAAANHHGAQHYKEQDDAADDDSDADYDYVSRAMLNATFDVPAPSSPPPPPPAAATSVDHASSRSGASSASAGSFTFEARFESPTERNQRRRCCCCCCCCKTPPARNHSKLQHQKLPPLQKHLADCCVRRPLATSTADLRNASATDKSSGCPQCTKLPQGFQRPPSRRLDLLRFVRRERRAKIAPGDARNLAVAAIKTDCCRPAALRAARPLVVATAASAQLSQADNFILKRKTPDAGLRQLA